jgi:hypothetical protein
MLVSFLVLSLFNLSVLISSSKLPTIFSFSNIGECAVHVKELTSIPYQGQRLIEQFVLPSINEGNVWTFWSPNQSEIIKPTLNFFEQCSLNIVVDEKEHPNTSSMNHYFERNLYTLKPWKYSTFLIVRPNYAVAYPNVSLRLDHKLFAYSIDCEDLHCSKSFRYFAFEKVSRNWVKLRLEASFASLFLEGKTDDLSKLEIDWLVSGVTDPYPQCLKTFWHKIPSCSHNGFTIQTLKSRLNFTYTQSSYGYESKNPYGLIAYSLKLRHLNNFRDIFRISLDAHGELNILYGDFYVRRERIEFQAFSSPFLPNLWLLFYTSTLFSTLTMFSNRSLKDSGYIKRLTFAVSSMYRLLMGQELCRKKLGFVLLSFSITIITNLYKNEITSKLIAQPSKEIIKDLVDLIDKGYRVTYPEYRPDPISRETARQQMLQDWFRNAYKIRDRNPSVYEESRLYPMKSDWWNESEFLETMTNPKEKTGYVFSDDQLSDRIQYLAMLYHKEPKFSYHIMKEPVYRDWYFNKFENVMSHKQVELTNLFRENGLFAFWSRLIRNLYELQVRTRFGSEAGTQPSEVFIFLPNLAPVFIILVALLLCTSAAFLGEIIHADFFSCSGGFLMRFGSFITAETNVESY